MANPITDFLWNINSQVSKLSGVSLTRVKEVLDEAEAELTKDLAKWKLLGKGDDRFTPQVYRNALTQIRGTLDHINGATDDGMKSALQHGGALAAQLATSHLIKEVQTFSAMFEHSVRPIAFESAALIAEGKKLLWPTFANSAHRYAGQVGEDIRKQLAIGLVRGETIDQLTSRLAHLGGPKGFVYLAGRPGSPNAKAEVIAEGLFRRYRHWAERLAVTETVNAYNSVAMLGMEELEEEDPGYYRRWDAAIDGRTCKFCGYYDDMVVKLNETFPGGIEHPPLHPRCRCAVVVWRKEWKESNFKDDLVKQSVKGREPKGVASIPHVIKIDDKPKKPKQVPPKPAIKPDKPKKEAKASTPGFDTKLEYAKMSPERREKFNELAESWEKKLTEEELKRVKSYQGAAYENVNTYLRKGPSPKDSEMKKENYAKFIGDLDSAIAKGHAEKDMLVYRGTKTDVLKKMKVGDVFQDKAFMSTSENEEVLHGLFTGSKGNVFHIEVPKGTPTGILSGMGGEYERLLPRGTKLQILGFHEEERIRPDGTRDKTGRTVVRARVVQ